MEAIKSKFRLAFGVESLLLLNMLGGAIRAPLIGELFRRSVCRDLHYSAAVCANLQDHPDASRHVATAWSQLNAEATVPHGVFALLSGILVAAWSDRFGRRPLLFATPVSDVLMCAFLIVGGVIAHVPSWSLVVVPPLLYLLGASGSLSSIARAYLADENGGGDGSSSSMSLRFAILDGVLLFGWASGHMIAALLVEGKYVSDRAFIVAFAASLLIALGEVLYVAVFLKESLRLVHVTETSSSSWRVKAKAFISWRSVRDVVDVVLVARPHRGRSRLLILLGVVVLDQLVGVGSIMQPYLESYPFNWTLSRFTFVEGLTSYGWMLVFLVVMPLQRRYWPCRDETYGMFGSFCRMLQRVSFALAGGAGRQWLILVGFGVAFGAAPLYPAVRALVSRSVSEHEQAKVRGIAPLLNGNEHHLE